MVNTYNVPLDPEALVSHERIPQGSAVYFEHLFALGGAEYSLEARILFNDEREKPKTLYLHGARAGYSKSDAISLALRDRGVSLLGPNLSGHNKHSPLNLKDTTPGQNVAEALTFYGYLEGNGPHVLMLYSLGAVFGLNVLRYNLGRINKLVLFGPALYSWLTYSEHYGEGNGVQRILREEYSYENEDVMDALIAFNRLGGKLMLLHGQYDCLEPYDYELPLGFAVGYKEIDGAMRYSPIPRDVLDRYLNCMSSADSTIHIEVPGASHSIGTWMTENPKEANPYLDRIAQFILG